MTQIQTLLKSNFTRFAIAFGIVVLCTIICLPLRDKVAASSLPMLHILGVVIAASWLGLWPSIFSSILSVIAFNFFFTQAYHSLDFDDNSYYFTFGVKMCIRDSGISGQNTAQMLLRFNQDVIALKPKTVVILGGTNDICLLYTSRCV